MVIDDKTYCRTLIQLFGLVKHVKNRQRLLTEEEVAYIFQVDPKTIARWRKAGLIDHITFEGSIIRYTWPQVERRIESCKKTAQILQEVA